MVKLFAQRVCGLGVQNPETHRNVRWALPVTRRQSKETARAQGLTRPVT